MAHSYSHIYNLQTTGLRLFTVYGPLGRPDMAPMIFSDAILNNKEIKLFNFGKSLRDFTYIDDVVESIYRCLLKLPNKNNNPKIKSDNTSSLFKIFNVGNSSPVLTADFVNILEKSLKRSKKFSYP